MIDVGAIGNILKYLIPVFLGFLFLAKGLGYLVNRWNLGNRVKAILYVPIILIVVGLAVAFASFLS